jgi:hypothetical protein
MDVETSPRTSTSQHVNTTLANNNSDFECYSWLADCATTSHIVCEERTFAEYQKIDRTIMDVGDAYVKAVGCGTVILKSHIDGENKKIILRDALHVPTSKDNLLSMAVSKSVAEHLLQLMDAHSSTPHLESY